MDKHNDAAVTPQHDHCAPAPVGDGKHMGTPAMCWLCGKHPAPTGRACRACQQQAAPSAPKGGTR
jgi:hypothetical protein